MSKESSQKWLERNRPPRVQISYDVETAGAIEKKELPMVVGILSDLSGMRDDAATPPMDGLAKRRFIEIDRDNFDKVLEQIGPRIDIAKLGIDSGLGLSGVLTFDKLEQFSPDHLVTKVAGLNALFEARNQLRDLMAKIDGNTPLETQLATALGDQGVFTKWVKAVGAPTPEPVVPPVPPVPPVVAS